MSRKKSTNNNNPAKQNKAIFLSQQQHNQLSKAQFLKLSEKLMEVLIVLNIALNLYNYKLKSTMAFSQQNSSKINPYDIFYEDDDSSLSIFKPHDLNQSVLISRLGDICKSQIKSSEDKLKTKRIPETASYFPIDCYLELYQEQENDTSPRLVVSQQIKSKNSQNLDLDQSQYLSETLKVFQMNEDDRNYQKQMNLHKTQIAPKVQKKKPFQPKKDEKKMCMYSYKHILKQFLSSRYKKCFDKQCLKYQIRDQSSAMQYYKSQLKCNQITIGFIYKEFNFNLENQDNSEQLKYRQAFHQFYVWSMRNRYAIHILTEDKIKLKDRYFQKKNLLIYLPALKNSKPFRPMDEIKN